MAKDDKYLRKSGITPQDEDDDAESGQGGQAGQIGYEEFVFIGESQRPKQLPAEEMSSLHAAAARSETHIKKQMESRQLLEKAKKEGSSQIYRQGRGEYGAGMNGAWKPHLLGFTAQFSGMDKKTTPLANETTADANQDKRDEKALQLQYQLQLQNRLQLQHAPRPTTPTLKRL